MTAGSLYRGGLVLFEGGLMVFHRENKIMHFTALLLIFFIWK